MGPPSDNELEEQFQDKLKELVFHRGQIKSHLTRFSSFVNAFYIANKSATELEKRLSTIESYFNNFDSVQSQIELLTNNDDKQLQERVTFEEAFYSTVSSAQDIINNHRKALPGQNLSEYCFNKLDKLKELKIDIPQDYLADAIITGINNEDVVRAARSSKFSDTNELYAYLSTLNNLPQNFTRLERKQFVYQPSTSAADAKNSVNSNNKVSKGVICFNCQGQHYFKNCPKPKLECFHCKKLGHKQNQCPLKSTKNSFKKQHTGSTRTLLKRSVIEKLGLRIENNDIGKLVLRGFSGNLVVSEGTVAVRIRMDNACAELEVIVLDDEQMMHDCIIGCDFLNLPQVLFYKNDKGFVIKGLNVRRTYMF
ncbi:unnamed protein product [Ceutorhynchus assimilis]|uniref:CCHC-type domain-containing protein n=1 Tax=Ceutorhynchus assimilis TaxID=467358 RepID=A0A9N9QPS0_9CUCU|nr:unnamed protein product [Ceutorhynchus assimilis]